MRSVVAAEYVTIDGVMEDPGDSGEFEHAGWSSPYFNDELAKYQSDQLFASDALLLGRETFQAFAAAWPTREEAEEGDFGVRMNTLPKYVASQTLSEPLPWNGQLIKGDVAEAVTKLKEEPGEQILIYGSARLVNALLTHDLIDRYRLMVFPVTVGTGKRLFTNASLRAFNLAEAKTTSTGVAMLTYDLAQ